MLYFPLEGAISDEKRANLNRCCLTFRTDASELMYVTLNFAFDMTLSTVTNPGLGLKTPYLNTANRSLTLARYTPIALTNTMNLTEFDWTV